MATDKRDFHRLKNKFMKYIISSCYLLVGILFVLVSCGNSKNLTPTLSKGEGVEVGKSAEQEKIITGAERYNIYIPLLKDKKLGL